MTTLKAADFEWLRLELERLGQPDWYQDGDRQAVAMVKALQGADPLQALRMVYPDTPVEKLPAAGIRYLMTQPDSPTYDAAVRVEETKRRWVKDRALAIHLEVTSG